MVEPRPLAAVRGIMMHIFVQCERDASLRVRLQAKEGEKASTAWQVYGVSRVTHETRRHHLAKDKTVCGQCGGSGCDV
jgi:predicted molibdopterin-dependent oxidoreductase YjgC